MKKLLLAFFMVLAGLEPVSAQDYAPFRMGRTPYFQAGDSVYALRITNAYVQGTDSVFEFNPRFVGINGVTLQGCNGFINPNYTRSVNNVFGHRMVKTPNQEYTFVFSNGISYLLKPHAQAGSSWVFGQTPQLTATLVGRSHEMVHGQADSVATIAFSNGDTLQLSQSFGLLQARSFYSYLNSAASIQPLKLVRLPEAGIGIGIHHPFRIYDFQPGDKFLYEGYNHAGFAPCYAFTTTMEVLSRADSPDSIVYRFKKQRLTVTHPNMSVAACSSFGQTPPPAGTTLSAFDTVSLTITPEAYPHLTDLSYEFADRPLTYSYYPNTGYYISGFNNRLATASVMFYPDTCSQSFIYGPDGSGAMRYAEGLGHLRLMSEVTGHETLIAYIKGTETYGNWQPLVLSAEEELAQNPLQVSPNPFISEFEIQLPEATSAPAEITLFNLQGQRVHQQTVTDLPPQTGIKVQLPSLPAGLYLLQLHQGGKRYTAKVQKQ